MPKIAGARFESLPFQDGNATRDALTVRELQRITLIQRLDQYHDSKMNVRIGIKTLAKVNLHLV